MFQQMYYIIRKTFFQEAKTAVSAGLKKFFKIFFEKAEPNRGVVRLIICKPQGQGILQFQSNWVEALFWKLLP